MPANFTKAYANFDQVSAKICEAYANFDEVPAKICEAYANFDEVPAKICEAYANFNQVPAKIKSKSPAKFFQKPRQRRTPSQVLHAQQLQRISEDGLKRGEISQ